MLGRAGPARSVLRRTRSLAVAEAVNVVWLPVVFLGFAGVGTSVANLAGLGLLVLLLLEGCGYWILKHRQILRGQRYPSGMTAFRWLARSNIVLLALGLLVICTGFADSGIPWSALAFWVFAVLEHVNYFHVQLMHDTRADLRRLRRTGALRRSHLAADLTRTAHRGRRKAGSESLIPDDVKIVEGRF